MTSLSGITLFELDCQFRELHPNMLLHILEDLLKWHKNDDFDEWDGEEIEYKHDKKLIRLMSDDLASRSKCDKIYFLHMVKLLAEVALDQEVILQSYKDN